MKEQKTKTPEDFVRWVIKRRKNATLLGKSRIDLEVASLYRRGLISSPLFEQYKKEM
ncbi:MAG: hypothetical protein Q7R93_04845 [bacterium]|nr:hypothetical protein [bacterium]